MTDIPQHLGRYRVLDVLGQGATGIVYRGLDDQLDRPVAIKVRHPQVESRDDLVESFLKEARILASLDHPAILSVHDVGQTDHGDFYVVTKFIEGIDLKARMKQGALTRLQAVEIIAKLAKALDYAHQHHLIHRDVKPGNVLLDAQGEPYLIDFGLAFRQEEAGTGPKFVGTVPYMSPEQARREGHRVDRRTDIYSLGATFYQMLTGRLPFVTDSKQQMLEMIRTQDATPPREIDPTIPVELERICLKAVANRISDRYSRAGEMAEDLKHWLDEARGKPVPKSEYQLNLEDTPVVPHGLRAFDARDSTFFLNLLPGPRNREGLPESIAFWKTLLENRDDTTPVGVLYGASGCGKSSLVKAGLLPILSRRVTPVYLEATAHHTEDGLLRALQMRFPDLPPDVGLVETMRALRHGHGQRAGQKVVVVLDQFEQWLSAPRGTEDRTLVEALRQCDGARVQALLLVRDDFWLALSRFLRDLEINLVEGSNAALVDLFDPPHARKILAKYGEAYHCIPEVSGERTVDEEQFLDQAVESLAIQGKISPVRLSLFAEMIKGKPWTTATLHAVGGAEGIGVAFLEDTFGPDTVHPGCRIHERAARAVLGMLLPDEGSDLKGHLRSRDELVAHCGYAGNPAAFEDLIDLLDRQLRLVTPADPEGLQGTGDPALASASAQHYQLTHDFLVTPTRDWLTRGQRQTWRGRAGLALEARSRAWNVHPEIRQLPSWWEWLTIRVSSTGARWTDTQRRMMTAANSRHLTRTFAWGGAIVILALGALFARLQFVQQRNTGRVDVLLAWLRQPHSGQWQERVAELRPYLPWALPQLRAMIDDPKRSAEERLHARLLLANFEPDEQIEPLVEALSLASADDVIEIGRVLKPYKGRVLPRLRPMVNERRVHGVEFLRAAGVIAGMDPEEEGWASWADEVSTQLIDLPPIQLSDWLEVFRPVRLILLPKMRDWYMHGNRPDYAADVFVTYGYDQPVLLAQAIGVSQPRQFQRLFPVLEQHREEALAEIQSQFDNPSASSVETVAQRRARLGIALLRMGHGDRVWSLLKQSPDPLARSYFVHFASSFHLNADLLYERYLVEKDVSIRRALILALGGYSPDQRPSDREKVSARFLADWKDEPDPGLHSSLEWLFGRWQITLPPANKDSDGRQWRVNATGDTFAILNDKHKFALATKEVTVAQFLELLPDTVYDKKVCADPSAAMAVNWYTAARYCRLLSEREKIPDHEMCYPPVDEIKPGMKVPDDHLLRTGYRLPTEAEWEYACRAGTTTTRYYGDSVDLLPQYGWYTENSQGKSQPVGKLKPNDFGMFDMLGNVIEWCDEWYRPDPKRPATPEEVERYVDRYRAKVLRGGELTSPAGELDANARGWDPADTPPGPPDLETHYSGFRLVRTVK